MYTIAWKEPKCHNMAVHFALQCIVCLNDIYDSQKETVMLGYLGPQLWIFLGIPTFVTIGNIGYHW